EASAPLRPRAPQRVEEPLLAVDALQEAVHLRAEPAARERVLPDAGEPDGAPVGDLHLPGAGVGTVVRAGAADEHAPRLARPPGAVQPDEAHPAAAVLLGSPRRPGG